MPYIITPGVQTTDAGTNYESTAVETHEEAARRVCELLNARYHGDESDFDWSLPDVGGTVGPAPDGYVIDVTFCAWGDLNDWTHYPETDEECREIIDAFNDR